MVDWKYLLLAQYPACLLLAALFLINYLRVRTRSAVKSVLWVLLFGVALAAAVLFAFLGVHYEYWALGSLFKLGLASWIGLALVVAALIAHIVHGIEVKRNRKIMEKELEKAAKEKEHAVAQAREEAEAAARHAQNAAEFAALQAREEGRQAAQREAEEARLAQAQDAAGAEAAQSDMAQAAAEPIELKLGE